MKGKQKASSPEGCSQVTAKNGLESLDTHILYSSVDHSLHYFIFS